MKECPNNKECFKARIKEPKTHDAVCKRCDRVQEIAYDKCIQKLPGVKFACCGHGNIGYITFENNVTIRGKFWVCNFEKNKLECEK